MNSSEHKSTKYKNTTTKTQQNTVQKQVKNWPDIYLERRINSTTSKRNATIKEIKKEHRSK